MIHKFLSIRPTIFGGVIAFAALSLAACSPVAIMMPQTGSNDQSAMPAQSSSNSLVEESIAGEARRLQIPMCLPRLLLEAQFAYLQSLRMVCAKKIKI